MFSASTLKAVKVIIGIIVEDITKDTHIQLDQFLKEITF